MTSGTVSAEEVAKFDRIAARWWDPNGPMKPLHRMNPARIAWINSLLDGPTRILDVGCGAGLAAEALAKLGHDVLGIDAAGEAIEAAKAHAAGVRAPGPARAPGREARPETSWPGSTRPSIPGPCRDELPHGHRVDGRVEPGHDEGIEASPPLRLAYRTCTAEDLQREGRTFPVIAALEVVEHVPNPAAFVRLLASLLEPGGLLILSTLNRTRASFLTAKLGAEYVLRILPVGTHDWRAFLTPAELARVMRMAGLRVHRTTGLRFDALTGQWRTGRDMSVNYMMAGIR